MCRILIALILGTATRTIGLGGFWVALIIAATTYLLPLYLDSTSIITSQNALFLTANVTFPEVASVAKFYYNSCFLAVPKRILVLWKWGRLILVWKGYLF